jgi:protein disulfide-isomerase A1
MKSKLLILLPLILFSIKAEVTEDEGVLVLTDANFDEEIKKHEYLLVEFYAPWCGHCKKLKPEYERAAKTLRGDNPPMFLAKVDATEQKELGKRFDVSGYPTLKFFVKGEPMDYEGGRTESEIVNWMRKKTGPASREYKTATELEEFQKANDVVIVFFGTTSSPLFQVYELTAKGFDDLSFGHCQTEECRTHFKASENSVVIFKKFDEGRNDLTEAFTNEKLKTFLDGNTTPTVMKFDEKCAQHIFGKSQPAIFLYRDKNSENTEKLDQLFTAIAKKVKGKIQAVITDIKEGLETRLAEYIGVTSKDLPTVRIADTRNDLLKFNMQGEITEENVLKFIDDWETGKLRATFKSEEIPEKQENEVVVVVGKSFEQVVLDDSKDVLVEFYAPWCGHCKKLTPIYEELAKKLKHNKSLVIAKVDATANEVEGVNIKGFPTIKFWAGGKKSNPIDYDGDRTVEGFMTWLEKHCTYPITKEGKTDL